MKKRRLDKPTVAEELRAWRKQQGWTRKRAAEFLGVNAKTLESWELGYRTPPMMNVMQKLWADKRRNR